MESASDSHLAGLLREVDEPVVLCGHTHRPMVRTVEHWQIFNGGSVGAPYNGDPRAHYLLLDVVHGRWWPTLRQVDYDRDQVATAFVTSGFLADVGPLAELDLRTILTGEPWSSDFGHWMRVQPPALQQNVEAALPLYLQTHGPGRWAFDVV